ncbi:DUF4007 family protein [Flavisolibacter sp. BT320]|nr:DUF4007 family protein [Flavisolibacter longurius]
MIETAPIKYTFSGHESFQCRNLWLKKGYDYVAQNRSFNDGDAVVALGVGKNMVASIRFWLKAFNIITPKDEITDFGRHLLADDGWDPYLEDVASLWLLHYQLVKNNFASTYHIIFNEFRREKIEFTRDTYVSYLKKRAQVNPAFPFTENTAESDFDVFKKMYLSTADEATSIEDGFSGILCELNLVRSYKKEKTEWAQGKEKSSKYDSYYIENEERPNLPAAVFLYAVLDNQSYGKAIALQSLEHAINSPGAVFALNRTGLVEKINEITDAERNITYFDHAGIKELQISEEKNPFTVLKQYYEG